MKVHIYVSKIYESAIDFTHGMSQNQTRLYIPNTAVIGFRNIDEGVDFFSDSPKSLIEGEEVILGKKEGTRYIGFIELPDEIVSNAISSGREMNKSKKSLQIAVKSLNDIMTPRKNYR